MTPSALFNRRLQIFSGKGGVGKSTLVAAAAVAAARQGRRVLIVEIGEHESISRLFGTPVSGFAGGTVYRPRTGGAPPIVSMCITARESLREYAMRSVRFELVYNAVFENAAVRAFTDAAPGLQELHLLGKIERLQSESVAPAPHARFDLMLLDAPATGHALALFEAPRMVMRMVPMGPIYSMVERAWRLLSDPSRTALNIVSRPEEMPIAEAVELDRAAAALGIPRGLHIVNGVLPDLFPEGMGGVDRVQPGTPLTRTIVERARSTVRLRAEQDALIAKLGGGPESQRLLLPLVTCARIGPREIETLADHVGAF